MLRTILEWPNTKLRKNSNPIGVINEETIKLAEDLVDTCNVNFGVGLAAPQIGVQKRMIVLKPSACGIENPDPFEYNTDFMVLINPVLELSGESVSWVEACLSVPYTEGKVDRISHAVCTYLSMDGETKKLEATWPFSGALQHECDHLDGELYIFKIPRGRRSMILQKLKKERKRSHRASKRRRE